MRHVNSVSQVNKERDKEIILLYNRAREIVGTPATIDRICKIAANMSVSKFYISDEAAMRYIQDRKAGRPRTFRNKYKRTLYNALFDTYRYLSKRKEYTACSMARIIDIALSQPAPFIGLSPDTLQRYLCRRLNIYQYDIKVKAATIREASPSCSTKKL